MGLKGGALPILNSVGCEEGASLTAGGGSWIREKAVHSPWKPHPHSIQKKLAVGHTLLGEPGLVTGASGSPTLALRGWPLTAGMDPKGAPGGRGRGSL